MVKQFKYEDWSQRLRSHRAKKAVNMLNNERKLGLVFPLINILSGLIVLYVIARWLWGR